MSKKQPLSITHPELSKEWHPTKNKPLTPKDVTHGSHKKVWWVCKKGHDFLSALLNRSNGKGCPYCSGHRTGYGNDLKTLYPVIAKQWHPTKNGDLKPIDVTPGSNRKVWWICKKGDDHIWKTIINNRTRLGRSCPVCSNQKIVKSNCLSTLRPDLLKELHSTKNANFDPTTVGIGSKNKVWWICNRGHSWKTAINLRARRKTGCPFCKNTGTSLMEIRLLSELSYFFKGTKHRYKVKSVECDIFIPKVKLAVEYDGKYWHKNNYQKDKDKSDFFLSNGYQIIRIREKGLIKTSKNDVIHDIRKKDIVLLCDLFQRILDFEIVSVSKKKEINKYITDKVLVNDDYYKELQDRLPKPILGKSLEERNSKLSEEWHPTKNGNLLPNDVTDNSGKKVWWLCVKGHEYLSRIDHRTGGSGCPYCYGRLPTKKRNLSTEYPEVAIEFHPTKNGDILPEQVTPHSRKKYWWKCSKVDEHEWEASVDSRTGINKTGCSYCTGHKVGYGNDLESLFPKVAKQWHPKKNKNIKPNQFRPKSHKKVWWICNKGHEWDAVISSRTLGFGCPYCSGNRKQ